MKAKVIAIIGGVVIIVLAIIVSTISNSRPDRQLGSTSITIPTPVVIDRAGQTTNSTQLNSLDDLTQNEQDALKNVQLSLPVEDPNIAIAYSPITQQVFVQKKTPQADATLDQFLSNNNLDSIYASHPNFFVITRQNLQETMLQAEEDAGDTLVPDDDEEVVETQKTNQEKIDEVANQMNALKNLVGVIFAPPQPPTPTSPTIITPSITETPLNLSSIDLDYAARNSCYRFRINRCEDIPETRPGVTNNTYPVDKAIVEELFANPNAYGLKNRRWQFDAGMVHPKLVRFLNEFVKTNTLDRHLGIAGGTGRCCRRNGSTKGPSSGCKLTPHRLGVAIDLDTLNGSRFIKAKVDDPGIRKALDWINAQKGSLRPDSVTMSPVFTGLYPFHPDSGHTDHLHLDFSRSLSCQ